MSPQRHDVYLIKWRLRKSFDHRPCIVLDVDKDSNTCVILVSSSDLHKSGDFKISADHPDFHATGLTKTSYALGDQIHEVPISQLVVRRGALQGDLMREFDKWID